MHMAIGYYLVTCWKTPKWCYFEVIDRPLQARR